MTSDWRQRRETFRHGDLPRAVLDAALEHLAAEEATALNLRKLARDVGVDHRALYRHFPGKLALMAAIAGHGWRKLGERMTAAALAKPAGEETLVACGVGFILFARENANLFHLMAGPRLNVSGSFPDLDQTVFDALRILQQGFADLGHERDDARARAALFAAALQGVSAQILYRRLRVSTRRAATEMANISRKLINGLR